MDVSVIGLGAMLEQGGHVIAYASQTLTKCESNYSIANAKEMFSHYTWYETFSSLFIRLLFYNDRLCTNLMAIYRDVYHQEKVL